MRMVIIPNEDAESQKRPYLEALAKLDQAYRIESSRLILKMAEIDGSYAPRVILVPEDKFGDAGLRAPNNLTYSAPGL